MARGKAWRPQRRASRLNGTEISPTVLAELESKNLRRRHRNTFRFGRITVVSLRSHGRTNRCVVTRNVDECDPHSGAARCVRWDYGTKGSRRAEPRLKNSSCHRSRVVAQCVKSRRVQCEACRSDESGVEMVKTSCSIRTSWLHKTSTTTRVFFNFALHLADFFLLYFRVVLL